MKKLILITIVLVALAACTTVRIPTEFGEATVTAPVFMTTQEFSLTRTSDTLAVKYQRGTDPQATTITSAAISAAITAAKKVQ